MKKIIETKKAPQAVGPYSQAVLCNQVLYVSGQLPIDPITNQMPVSVEDQTNQSLTNLLEIVKEANFEKEDIVKCSVYLKDMNDFQKMNACYQAFFGDVKPARVTVEVARLPKDALVEIDAIVSK